MPEKSPPILPTDRAVDEFQVHISGHCLWDWYYLWWRAKADLCPGKNALVRARSPLLVPRPARATACPPPKPAREPDANVKDADYPECATSMPSLWRFATPIPESARARGWFQKPGSDGQTRSPTPVPPRPTQTPLIAILNCASDL